MGEHYLLATRCFVWWKPFVWGQTAWGVYTEIFRNQIIKWCIIVLFNHWNFSTISSSLNTLSILFCLHVYSDAEISIYRLQILFHFLSGNLICPLFPFPMKLCIPIYIYYFLHAEICKYLLSTNYMLSFK